MSIIETTTTIDITLKVSKQKKSTTGFDINYRKNKDFWVQRKKRAQKILAMLVNKCEEGKKGEEEKKGEEADEMDLVNCIICFDEEGEDDEMITLGCQHSFHKTCLEEWFGEMRKCPVCRANFNEDNYETF